jgi:dihydrofolate reductase
MGKLRVNAFSVSLDGFAAGPGQDLQNPMGVGAMRVHEWVFPTRSFKAMHGGGGEGGETGIDNDFSLAAMDNLGAWILGRNMFGPIRGPWPNDEWKGWWGPNPPYHVPVFVLTHYPRAPLEMEGGNVFHFVTGGVEEALKLAKQAAGDKDVRVGGGAATVRQYLRARLIDTLHIAVSPVLVGAGENLFAGLDLATLGYQVSACKAGERAGHYMIERV